MVDLALLQSVSYIAGALGVSVAATYYVMTLRETVKNRRAQVFINLYNQLQQKESQRQWFSCGQADYKDYDDFMKKYSFTINPDFWTDFAATSAYLEGIGVFAEDGLIDVRMVEKLIGGGITWWWSIFEKYIFEERVRNDTPDFLINTEHLVERVKEVRLRAGKGNWRRDLKKEINAP